MHALPATATETPAEIARSGFAEVLRAVFDPGHPTNGGNVSDSSSASQSSADAGAGASAQDGSSPSIYSRSSSATIAASTQGDAPDGSQSRLQANASASRARDAANQLASTSTVHGASDAIAENPTSGVPKNDSAASLKTSETALDHRKVQPPGVAGPSLQQAAPSGQVATAPLTSGSSLASMVQASGTQASTVAINAASQSDNAGPGVSAMLSARSMAGAGQVLTVGIGGRPSNLGASKSVTSVPNTSDLNSMTVQDGLGLKSEVSQAAPSSMAQSAAKVDGVLPAWSQPLAAGKTIEKPDIASSTARANSGQATSDSNFASSARSEHITGTQQAAATGNVISASDPASSIPENASDGLNAAGNLGPTGNSLSGPDAVSGSAVPNGETGQNSTAIANGTSTLANNVPAGLSVNDPALLVGNSSPLKEGSVNASTEGTATAAMATLSGVGAGASHAVQSSVATQLSAIQDHSSGVGSNAGSSMVSTMSHANGAGNVQTAGGRTTLASAETPSTIFAAMDGANPSEKGVLLRAIPHQVAIGVADPTLGWVEVRAERVSGQITASITADSATSHAALTAALPGIANYLHEQDSGVQQVHVESGWTGQTGGGSQGHGEPQRDGRSAAVQEAPGNRVGSDRARPSVAEMQPASSPAARSQMEGHQVNVRA